MRPRSLLRIWPTLLCIALPLIDLAWNLTHLNIGLPDFYGLALPARAFALHGAWPQTPYFPALYPLLLVPFGLAGSVLVGGYILSAGGLILALLAVRRLTALLVGTGVSLSAVGTPVRASAIPPLGSPADSLTAVPTPDALTGVPTGLSALVILLAWIMPVWRVVAGSPSVDALYTGLGLWFLAAAVEVWLSGVGAARARPGPATAGPYRATATARGTARSTVIILWLAALILPLLRYHAIILVFPVLLGLLLCRPRARWTARAALLAGISGVVVNYVGYLLAYGELLPQVAQLQIRCGIEFEQHIHYPTPQALWDDYAAFAQHGRSTPLLEDYSVEQVAKHILKNWLMFLRQPAVLLALVLVILGARSIKLADPRLRATSQLPLILVSWLLFYILSLSLAYYTARAALLPCLVGLAVLSFLMTTPAMPIRYGLVAVLLLGYLAGSRFAVQDFQQRMHWTETSRSLWKWSINNEFGAQIPEQYLTPITQGLVWTEPWCMPWQPARRSGSWLSDPAIPPRLVEGWDLYTEQ
jgi:hypothetical protein